MQCQNCDGRSHWLCLLMVTTALVAIVAASAPAEAGGERRPRTDVPTVLTPREPPRTSLTFVETEQRPVSNMTFGIGPLAIQNCCCGGVTFVGSGTVSIPMQ